MVSAPLAGFACENAKWPQITLRPTGTKYFSILR